MSQRRALSGHLNELRVERLMSLAEEADVLAEKLELLSPTDAAFVFAIGNKYRELAYSRYPFTKED